MLKLIKDDKEVDIELFIKKHLELVQKGNPEEINKYKNEFLFGYVGTKTVINLLDDEKIYGLLTLWPESLDLMNLVFLIGFLSNQTLYRNSVTIQLDPQGMNNESDTISNFTDNNQSGSTDFGMESS